MPVLTAVNVTDVLGQMDAVPTEAVTASGTVTLAVNVALGLSQFPLNDVT